MKLLTWADISLYVTEEFALVSGGEVKEKAKVGNKVETEIPIIAKIIATKKGVNTVIFSVHKHNENSKRTIYINMIRITKFCQQFHLLQFR